MVVHLKIPVSLHFCAELIQNKIWKIDAIWKIFTKLHLLKIIIIKKTVYAVERESHKHSLVRILLQRTDCMESARSRSISSKSIAGVHCLFSREHHHPLICLPCDERALLTALPLPRDAGREHVIRSEMLAKGSTERDTIWRPVWQG